MPQTYSVSKPRRGKKLPEASNGNELPAAAPPAVRDLKITTKDIGLVELALLHDSPFNPRHIYDQKKLEELAAAYVACPAVVPRLLVRPRPGAIDSGYELIHGHRRKRAAAIAGLTSLPCDLADVDDRTARAVQWMENGRRENLHPLEEADGFLDWLKSAKDGEPDITLEEIAAYAGQSISYVRSRLHLAHLIKEARQAVMDGQLAIGQAGVIAGLVEDQQHEALAHALNEGFMGRKPTLRELNRWVEEHSLDLSRAPWGLNDSMLYQVAGACSLCTKRTGATAELFSGVSTDRCLDRSCWDRKLEAQLITSKETLRVTGSAKPPRGALGKGSWVAIKEPESVDRVVREELGLRDDQPIPAAALEKANEQLGSWERRCEFARPAVTKAGKGEVTLVCAEKTCPVHGKDIASQARQVKARAAMKQGPAEPKRDYEAERKAEEAKRALELKVRNKVLEKVMEKLPMKDGRLQRGDLELVVMRAIGLQDTYQCREIRQRHGWGSGKVDLSKLKEADLYRLLWEDVIAGNRLEFGEAKNLLAQAKRFKVDFAAIRKEIVAGEKPKLLGPNGESICEFLHGGKKAKGKKTKKKKAK